MKIAITGASGFVGTALSDYLASNDHQIIKLHHSELVNNSLEQLNERLVDTEIFINLAGESTMGRWTDEKKKEIYDSRINVTRRIVEIINSMKSKPRLFISTSAIGYYKTDVYADEESPSDNVRFISKVCIDWEAEARKVSDSVKLVILRFGLIIGDEGGILPHIIKYLQSGLKIDFGTGKQKISWIHIEDLIRIYELIIEEKNEIPDIFNCVAPDIITMENMIDELSKRFHTVISLKIPNLILHTILKEGESLITGSYEVYSVMLPEIGYMFIYNNFEEVVKHLKLKD